MAMKSGNAPRPSAAPKQSTAAPNHWGAPAWVTPAYVAGLVLIYVGERVLSGLERGAGFFTLLGVATVLAATAIRFLPQYRGRGEPAQIGTLLTALSVVGLMAIAAYFATTDGGQKRLGLDSLAVQARQRAVSLLTVGWVSLLGLSVLPMLFAEGALRPMRHAERPESRRVRTAAVGGLTLTVAIVYSALFVFAASGADLKVDYSYFKTSRPSEATSKIAASLPDSVRIVAFFPDVNEVKNEVQSFLDELTKAGSKVKYEIKDRLLEPKLASDLRVTRDGVVVLSRGKINETLSFGTELDKAAPKLKTLDKDFQEKLLKVARARRTAYLTVGHGEINDRPTTGEAALGRTARIAKELLQKQNYEVKDLSLASGLGNAVPDDADIVMVLGPSDPFAREELATLERYASGGGHLLLALDPDVLAPANPFFEGDQAAPPATPPPTASSKVASAAPGAVKAGALEAGKGAAGRTPVPASGLTTDTQVALARTLTELATLAGVELRMDLLAHEKVHVRARFNDSDRLMLINDQFSSHASVSTLSRNARRLAVVVAGSGSLEKGASGGDDTVDFAVKTARDAFQDLNRNYKQDGDAEGAKAFNLVAAVTRAAAPRASEDAANEGAEEKGDDAPDHAKTPAPSASAAKDEDHKADSKPGDKKNDTKDRESKTDDKDGDKKNDDKVPDVPAPPEMRAFVIADADALGDLVMANVAGNQLLLVDAVRWLGGEESFAGAVNTEEDVRIEHTKQKDLIWFYGTIFGAPAVVLGAGLLVSRRSRRRSKARPRSAVRTVAEAVGGTKP